MTSDLCVRVKNQSNCLSASAGRVEILCGCTLIFMVLLCFCCLVKLIAECEQVKTERESDLIIDQVLIAMSAMGLDRERTLQV